MDRWNRGGMLGILASGIGLGLGVVPGGFEAPARAQLIERERDVTITGPRGRTIERKVRSERGPGLIDRRVEVTRPGGTVRREVQVGRRPIGPVGPIGPPPFYPGRPGFYRQREVIVERRPGLGGAFLAAPFFNFAFGAPAPPPVVIAPPPPVYVAPIPAPPPVVVEAPAPVEVDPYAVAMTRLQSHHDNSRRDGAYTLGRIGDPRAVPALVQQLKLDKDKDARLAAAKALGQIGDPRAANALELATVYDKRRDVRDAAAVALEQVRTSGVVVESAPVEGSAAPSTIPLTREYESEPVASEPTTIESEPLGGTSSGDGSSQPPPPLEPPPLERENVPPPPTPSNEPGFTDTP